MMIVMMERGRGDGSYRQIQFFLPAHPHTRSKKGKKKKKRKRKEKGKEKGKEGEWVHVVSNHSMFGTPRGVRLS
jgi:hypothetical protein